MFEFVGRADRQVKIRGFRVEPGEIETALNRVATVAASAVVPETDAGGHVHLVAYWVARDTTVATASEAISSELRRGLPDYMVPARIERVRELPLTPNGKIDRKRLQEAGVSGVLRTWGEQTSSKADETSTERVPREGIIGTLLELASTVLRTPVVRGDAERPMGELGFDSIRFTALSTAVARATGVTVEEARFYELKTLSAVAAHLAANGARAVVAPQTQNPHDAGPEGALAIIGMEARLPGARDFEEFWLNLVQGVDGVRPMTAERRTLAGESGAEFEGGYIDDVDKFDAPFFGISRREAAATDPRQRLFLEAAWRALEDASIKPSSLAGSRTGVFVGIVGGSEYGGESDGSEVDAGAQRILGAATSLIAARVSYQLDLRGPSHAIDTACSSSIVALHRAAVSLRAGECDLAIVGGINLVLDSATTRTAAKTGMISPTSRCRAFDAQADGYVRGEGVVALVLKPLARAQADGDPVHALVLGTAENHGGRAAGLTAPNPEAQRDVILAALGRAGVEAGTISYVEAHGTGTQLGDPIEINGLKAAFARSTNGATPSAPWCTLGALKSHIGHLEAAAGLAGVVKVVLAMRAGTIPGNLHLRTRNPRIALEGSPFALAETSKPWVGARDVAGREVPRRAGVSSFGFSGVNAHVVLEEFRVAGPTQVSVEEPVHFVLSAKTPHALARRAAQLESFLVSEPTCELRDVAATLVLGREAMAERVSFVVRDRVEARVILARLAAGESDARVRRDDAAPMAPEGTRRLHLPAYPFERRSYWAETSSPQSSRGMAEREVRTFDAKQAVLGEHRVGDRAILPAVAYLDWVLDVAGHGVFKPCEFRSVVWARAIEAGADPVRARVKIASTGEGLSFAVESDASPAVTHAKGLFAWLERATPQTTETVDATQGRIWEAEKIYRFFVERGMHYGPLFRTLRSASVGTRMASGELEVATPADECLLHPGMLDGMLQVAALLAIESGGEPGMPFTAERIRVFAPPGGRLTVQARRAADDTMELWAARPDGTVVLSLHGYVVRAPARAISSSRVESAVSLAVQAEAGVRSKGEVALGLDAERVERECAGMERLEMLGRLILLRELQAHGLLRAPGDAVSHDELSRVLQAVPRYVRLCASLGRFLAQSGLVEETRGGLRATARLGEAATRTELAELPAALERFKAEQPHLVPHATFVWSCIEPIARIINGSVLATDVMFPGGSVEFISKIYDGTVLMDYFNRVAAVAVRSAAEALLRTRPEGSVVRILEFGAGSGATSAWIAEELKELGSRVEYVFTDISVAFRRHGERRFGAQYPFMRFGVLNIERDPVPQGFAAGSFDIVIGANVLHTIKSLHRSLHLLKMLLTPGGMLTLVEGTESRVLNGLTYGLLDGWWNFEDPARRLPNAPLCDEEQWLRALREEGFTDARLVGKDSAPARRMTQAVIIGVSDGRIASDVATPAAAPQTTLAPAAAIAPTDTAALGDLLIEEVLGVVRHSLQAKDEVTGLDATFESLGVDSILAVEIVEKLNQRLPLKLRTTDVFNYASVRRLARRMEEILDADGRSKVLGRLNRNQKPETPTQADASVPIPATAPTSCTGDRRRAPIAIVGMAGQYAEAANLEDFWANLAAGRDCVREVPPDRWSIAEHFSQDRRAPGKTYSKWGGFLKDAAGFDPIFFNCSPREADLMDPQQRLFLMECYHALEDAGYSERMLDDQRCAVYAGVCAGDYQAQLDRAGQWAESHVFTGNATAILAGRLPYLLNLKGIGLAVDTACSSSLVAIHLACESLRSGSSTMALAGGVAVMSSERFHVWASKAGMLSASGRCRTFGSKADGMAPAEGVGVVVLKLLDDAVRDGDFVHGVILGSGVNQNGKSNGITAPSVPAQAELESHVYREFGVDPSTLDYVECHGTGTRLGDPMEVSALSDAFRQWTTRTGFCALGAVKSNIGHALAAAGVAGLLKVLLALKHREIPASLHCDEINDQLGLEGSPFVVARERRPWSKATPRRAAVSAFGFSGANAHAVIEEAPLRQADTRPMAPEHVVTLAAHTPMALRRRQEQLLAWLESSAGRAATLPDIAYTLNVGRTHFVRRWTVVVETREALGDALRAALSQPLADVTAEKAAKLPSRSGAGVVEQGWREMLSVSATRSRGLQGLMELYRAGQDVDWSFVHAGMAGRRIPLPGYPFELRRCWITAPAEHETSGLRLGKPERRGDEWLVAGTLAANAPMLAQHRVRGKAILPGVASLELARRVSELLRPGKTPILRNITWLRPLRAAADGADTHFSVCVRESAGVWAFAITQVDASDGVYARGDIEWDVNRTAAEMLDLTALRKRCRTEVSRDDFYARFDEGGVSYGPYFKVLRKLHRGTGEVLARLELPIEAAGIDVASGMLHPGLMDGALQAAAGLALEPERTGQGFRFPFGAGKVEIVGPLSTQLWVYARGSIETGAMVTLADEEGRIAVKISDYVTRAPKHAPVDDVKASYFTPTWREQALEVGLVRAQSLPSGAVWIVSRQDTEFERALAARHADAVHIRLGRRGTGGAGLDWRVDVVDAEAWPRLTRELPRPGAIYFSTGTLATADFPDELACVQAAKEEGVLALFRLVKALQACGWWDRGISLKVAVQGVWTLPGEEMQPPYFAAVAGFVGSLGREYAQIGAACIDMGRCEAEAAHAAAAALACEPLRVDSPRVAWRDGRRFEAGLGRMEVHG